MENCGELQMVNFSIGGEDFVVPITKVKEVIRPTGIVKIPKSYDFIEGVINLRGKIIPVVNLGKKLDIKAVSEEKKSRIIIAEVDDIIVGFQVGSVKEVLRINNNLFERAPSIVSSVDQKFIQGIVKYNDQMLIALDLDNVLTQNETRILKKVE